MTTETQNLAEQVFHMSDDELLANIPLTELCEFQWAFAEYMRETLDSEDMAMVIGPDNEQRREFIAKHRAEFIEQRRAKLESLAAGEMSSSL